MKPPRDLPGKELIKCLCRRWGYAEVNRESSHVTLEASTPSKHRVTVPTHDALKVGTLTNILNSVSRHKGVSRDAILRSL